VWIREERKKGFDTDISDVYILQYKREYIVNLLFD